MADGLPNDDVQEQQQKQGHKSHRSQHSNNKFNGKMPQGFKNFLKH